MWVLPGGRKALPYEEAIMRVFEGGVAMAFGSLTEYGHYHDWWRTVRAGKRFGLPADFRVQPDPANIQHPAVSGPDVIKRSDFGWGRANSRNVVALRGKLTQIRQERDKSEFRLQMTAARIFPFVPSAPPPSLAHVNPSQTSSALTFPGPLFSLPTPSTSPPTPLPWPTAQPVGLPSAPPKPIDSPTIPQLASTVGFSLALGRLEWKRPTPRPSASSYPPAWRTAPTIDRKAAKALKQALPTETILQQRSKSTVGYDYVGAPPKVSKPGGAVALADESEEEEEEADEDEEEEEEREKEGVAVMEGSGDEGMSALGIGKENGSEDEDEDEESAVIEEIAGGEWTEGRVEDEEAGTELEGTLDAFVFMKEPVEEADDSDTTTSATPSTTAPMQLDDDDGTNVWDRIAPSDSDDESDAGVVSRTVASDRRKKIKPLFAPELTMSGIYGLDTPPPSPTSSRPPSPVQSSRKQAPKALWREFDAMPEVDLLLRDLSLSFEAFEQVAQITIPHLPAILCRPTGQRIASNLVSHPQAQERHVNRAVEVIGEHLVDLLTHSSRTFEFFEQLTSSLVMSEWAVNHLADCAILGFTEIFLQRDGALLLQRLADHPLLSIARRTAFLTQLLEHPAILAFFERTGVLYTKLLNHPLQRDGLTRAIDHLGPLLLRLADAHRTYWPARVLVSRSDLETADWEKLLSDKVLEQLAEQLEAHLNSIQRGETMGVEAPHSMMLFVQALVYNTKFPDDQRLRLVSALSNLLPRLASHGYAAGTIIKPLLTSLSAGSELLVRITEILAPHLPKIASNPQLLGSVVLNLLRIIEDPVNLAHLLHPLLPTVGDLIGDSHATNYLTTILNHPHLSAESLTNICTALSPHLHRALVSNSGGRAMLAAIMQSPSSRLGDEQLFALISSCSRSQLLNVLLQAADVGRHWIWQIAEFDTSPYRAVNELFEIVQDYLVTLACGSLLNGNGFVAALLSANLSSDHIATAIRQLSPHWTRMAKLNPNHAAQRLVELPFTTEQLHQFISDGGPELSALARDPDGSFNILSFLNVQRGFFTSQHHDLILSHLLPDLATLARHEHGRKTARIVCGWANLPSTTLASIVHQLLPNLQSIAFSNRFLLMELILQDQISVDLAQTLLLPFLTNQRPFTEDKEGKDCARIFKTLILYRHTLIDAMVGLVPGLDEGQFLQLLRLLRLEYRHFQRQGGSREKLLVEIAYHDQLFTLTRTPSRLEELRVFLHDVYPEIVDKAVKSLLPHFRNSVGTQMGLETIWMLHKLPLSQFAQDMLVEALLPELNRPCMNEPLWRRIKRWVLDSRWF